MEAIKQLAAEGLVQKLGLDSGRKKLELVLHELMERTKEPWIKLPAIPECLGETAKEIYKTILIPKAWEKRMFELPEGASKDSRFEYKLHLKNSPEYCILELTDLLNSEESKRISCKTEKNQYELQRTAAVQRIQELKMNSAVQQDKLATIEQKLEELKQKELFEEADISHRELNSTKKNIKNIGQFIKSAEEELSITKSKISESEKELVQKEHLRKKILAKMRYYAKQTSDCDLISLFAEFENKNLEDENFPEFQPAEDITWDKTYSPITTEMKKKRKQTFKWIAAGLGVITISAITGTTWMLSNNSTKAASYYQEAAAPIYGNKPESRMFSSQTMAEQFAPKVITNPAELPQGVPYLSTVPDKSALEAKSLDELLKIVDSADSTKYYYAMEKAPKGNELGRTIFGMPDGKVNLVFEFDLGFKKHIQQIKSDQPLYLNITSKKIGSDKSAEKAPVLYSVKDGRVTMMPGTGNEPVEEGWYEFEVNFDISEAGPTLYSYPFDICIKKGADNNYYFSGQDNMLRVGNVTFKQDNPDEWLKDAKQHFGQ
jgi:hypothetical protein